MLFSDKKSALVRLSDTLKIGLDACFATSEQILTLFGPYEKILREAQRIAEQAVRGDQQAQEVEGLLQKVLASVPAEVSWKGVHLQGQLHSQSLSTILSCCFCLESYVNSLAYFLFEETDFLGLIKEVSRRNSEVDCT